MGLDKRIAPAQSACTVAETPQSSAVPAHRRGFGRPFPKGVSGNPGGRSKAKIALQEEAQKHAKAALAALVEALEDPKTRVPAAHELLDRGYGKAAQALTGPEGEPLTLSIHIDLGGKP